MEKRKWSSQEKLRIVLEGLSGNIEISKLCAKYQIAQTQYYQFKKAKETPEKNDLKRRNRAAGVFDAESHGGKTKRALGHQLDAREVELRAFHCGRPETAGMRFPAKKDGKDASLFLF